MKVAFIGGTGFIGAAAARAIVWRGHRVDLLHRGTTHFPLDGVERVTVDREDSSALTDALHASAPDVVVDTCAMRRAHARGLLDALPSKTSLVVLSSQDVYAQFGAFLGHECTQVESVVTEDSPKTVPYPFRDIPGQHGHPDYDKKDVEDEVFDSGVDACVLRLPATYGKRDPHRRFGAIVDEIAAQRPLPRVDGSGTWRWTHAHVDDIGHGIALAAEHVRSGARAFNLGEAEVPTMAAWAERFAEQMGVGLTWEDGEVPESLSPLGVMPNDLVVSSARAREELGYVEVTRVEQRVADIVERALEG